ncbi:unnamed protein product, partial [Phaeothamnion confervicola]
MALVAKGTTLNPGQIIDPLVHYVGQTAVRFVDQGEAPRLKDLAPFINRTTRQVTSSNGQLKLDYGRGLLTINAPMAQGVMGDMKQVASTATRDLVIASQMDLGAVVAVALDGQPLTTSGKILVQVMSEEQPLGFETAPYPDLAGFLSIKKAGAPTWSLKSISGSIQFTRPDAAQL